MTTDRAILIRKLQAEFRGILLSAGHHGLTITGLMRDFADLNGRPIPLRELGYNHVEELLMNDMQDVCSFWQNQNGGIILFPISHESTRHIERLIAGQHIHKPTRFGSVQTGRWTINRHQTTFSQQTYLQRRSISQTPLTESGSVYIPSSSTAACSPLGAYVSNVRQSILKVEAVPHSIASESAVIKKPNFLLAPAVHSSNVISVTTDDLSDPTSSSVVSNSLRRRILQPNFTLPLVKSEPPITHLPSAKKLTSQPSAQILSSGRLTMKKAVVRKQDISTPITTTEKTPIVTLAYNVAQPALAKEDLQRSKIKNRSKNGYIPSKNQAVYLELKGKIKNMIEKHSRRGIDIAIFNSAYEGDYGKRIEVQQLFGMSWRELLMTMSDICKIDDDDIVKPRQNTNANGTRTITSDSLAEMWLAKVNDTKPIDVNNWLKGSVISDAVGAKLLSVVSKNRHY